MVVLKRLESCELVFFCWNLSTGEFYIPLIVDKGRYDPMKELTYYERLFVNIDENRLYFRDFWEKSGGDRRDYITDEREQALASSCMLYMTKHKKYRKRFYRDKVDFKLIGKSDSLGKKALTINGTAYFQLAFIKFATGTVKICLFSKRTNDFNFVQYFYRDCKTVQELSAFARARFLECSVQCDMQYGGIPCLPSREHLSDFSLRQSRRLLPRADPNHQAGAAGLQATQTRNRL